mmetsp:Transcript_24372/g.48525  ORF Transcript_24372/g.48525 Transcript_24372/m.48525 type:complete len:336 (-) Transcript_24372:35-1042(-)
MMLNVRSPQLYLTLLLMVRPVFPLAQTFVVTHAGGRMGKLLASQIREGASLYKDAPANADGSPLVKIRAVVRTEEEAMSITCDLAGMTLRNGKTSYNKCDWLETVVVGDVLLEENARLLVEAFEGATGAILCDASHNELIQMDDGKWSLRIPANENKEISDRLLEEIKAATKSKSLEHVVLRSSMGLFLSGSDISSYEGDEAMVLEAVKVMGGDEALLGPRRAEHALRASDLDFTILRLGALTDDAGMVPIVFGKDDSLLLKRIEGQNTRRPPMLSRADAARVAASVLMERDFFAGKRLVIDCAWAPSWGRSSAGTEEAVSAASRQDLKKAILTV